MPEQGWKMVRKSFSQCKVHPRSLQALTLSFPVIRSLDTSHRKAKPAGVEIHGKASCSE